MTSFGENVQTRQFLTLNHPPPNPRIKIFVSKFRPCHFLHFIDPALYAVSEKTNEQSPKTDQRTDGPATGAITKDPLGKPGVLSVSPLSKGGNPNFNNFKNGGEHKKNLG